MISFSVIAVTLAAASAAIIPQAPHHHHDLEHHYEHHAPAHYKFEYGVHDPHTGDIKSQKESREGDAVKGYYTLKEADGTTREVHYTADKHAGFFAEVSRIGHPEGEHAWAHDLAAVHDFHVFHPHHHAKSHQSVHLH